MFLKAQELPFGRFLISIGIRRFVKVNVANKIGTT
jgi:hypothetical protein